jgi:hypothetical protein
LSELDAIYPPGVPRANPTEDWAARANLALAEAGEAFEDGAEEEPEAYADADIDFGAAVAPEEKPSERGQPQQLIAGDRFVLDAPEGVASVWGFEKGSVAWSRGEPVFLVGPQGVGKTTLAQRLGLARMGLASQVLGLPVVADERRVLYLAADRPHQAARSFRRMVNEEQREALAEKLIVWKGPFPPLSAKQPDALANLCQAVGAGTLIIDSTKDVALELSREETGQVFNLALQYVVGAGVEVLALHHQRKATGDNKKPTSLADVYGSTWITAGAGSVLLLWGDPGDPIVELTHLKQPAEELGPFNIIFDHVRGTVEPHDPADLEALVAAAPTGLTAAVAASALFSVETPSRNQIEKARRKLERLHGEGIVRRLEASEPGEPVRYVGRVA